MSETTSSSEPATGPVSTTPPPTYVHERRPNRLNQIAVWVGIVAGVVFIVAVIFGTGFILGKNSAGGGFDRGSGPAMIHRGGPPPMSQMGPPGEFPRGPFSVPGGPGAPDTTAPARP